MTVGAQEKSFNYSDALTLPAGRPAVKRLLGTRVSCTCSEARVIGTKLVFKGEAVLKVLCRGEDGKVFPAEFRLPYSQIMDAGEDSEDAICDLELLFTDVKCGLTEEDHRAFQAELALQAQAVLRKQVEVPVLADLYSTVYDLETEESPMTAQQLLGRSEEQEMPRGMRETQGLPVEILDVQARLGRTSQRQEGQDRVLTQEVQLMVLYLGEEGPVCLHEKVMAEHRMPGQGEIPCTFSGELLRAPTAAPAGEGVEGSLPLSFRWMALESQNVPLVSRVTLGEKREEEGQRPSVILRAVRQGETLWDVAKACLSTDQEILEASGLTSGELYPRQMLLIPRC